MQFGLVIGEPPRLSDAFDLVCQLRCNPRAAINAVDNSFRQIQQVLLVGFDLRLDGEKSAPFAFVLPHEGLGADEVQHGCGSLLHRIRRPADDVFDAAKEGRAMGSRPQILHFS